MDGVRLLLAHGADYRTIDSFGEGILHWLAGSGLEMLRLFKGIGIGIGGTRGSGVDMERRDNRGKTAMEIMEGRWDLTEEFRREFLELVDGMREEEEEVVNELEDDDLSEDEFFDAPDDLTTTLTPAPEEQELSKKDSPQSDLQSSDPTDPSSVNVEALSSTPSEQHDLQDDLHENIRLDEEILPDEVDTESDCNLETTSQGDEESGRWRLNRTDCLVQDSDAGQEESRNPRVPGTDTDKVLINEAGLKFRGTSTAVRSR